MLTFDGWAALPLRLAEDLNRRGVLAPGWRDAFEHVPRHAFVPVVVQDDGTHLRADDPSQREAWLAAVYQDQSLVTQVKDVPGQTVAWPTSSSTRPSLMALMLNMLDVRLGQRVLEIGTGTGYNAALLAHRLGSDRVTSIDIDPALVNSARASLDRLELHPHIVAGDGAKGVPGRQPFDRIIATCAVPRIPTPWIEQLLPGGRLVCDIRNDVASALATLTKTQRDEVNGHFREIPGHFMWLRRFADNPLRDGGTLAIEIGPSNMEAVEVNLEPGILDNPHFRFMLMITAPQLVSLTPLADRRPGRCIRLDDSSWAELAPTDQPGRVTLEQGGPRNVWDVVTSAIDLWNSAGRPDPSRVGITANVDGRCRYWLDENANVIADWSATTATPSG